MDATIAEAATRYLGAGLSVIPCRRSDKRPLVAWREYQAEAMVPARVPEVFANADAVGIVCGAVSGNVEMIDFDLAGEAFPAWRAVVDAAAPGLVDRLLIEQTQSGGLHVAYRIQGEVPGNLKLAERRIETRGPEPIRLGSRPYTPRRDGDRFVVQVALIETRGEGGMFLAAPSSGYVVLQGDFGSLPLLTRDERDLLIGAAGSLSEVAAPVEDDRPIGVGVEVRGDRPGDEFNSRGDIRETLRRHDWTLAGEFGGQEHWRRPGKHEGTSATLKDGVFFNFSSSAAPFDPNRGYSQFAIFAALEHGGDYTAAAAALASEGYGRTDDSDIDLTRILASGTSGDEGGGVAEAADASQAISYRVLVESSPSLRPVVIEGLLREGETMNVIAAPKVGKSWLTMDLAIAVATGRPWLGRFGTSRGRVLLLDNELHRETLASRFPRVAEARGVDDRELYEGLFVDNLRGRLLDFHRLRRYLESIPRGWYRLIVLDAFYRFLPSETDENSNGDMARIYSLVDHWADRLGASFAMVHHASKGSQAGKAVTDVGAGAGAQSRATDTHLVLRHHEEEDVVVLDAAVRSFPPVVPICLRWQFPTFDPDYELDPTLLRTESRGRRRGGSSDGGGAAVSMTAWTTTRFVAEFVGVEGEGQGTIEARAQSAGLSERHAKRLMRQAIAGRLVVQDGGRYCWRQAEGLVLNG